MKRTVEITLERARELYKRGGEDVKMLLLDTFTESELSDRVTRWEDLGYIQGFWVKHNSSISRSSTHSPTDGHKNLWATKEQAEACLAMSQLSQLMKRVNGDWNYEGKNHGIYRVGDNIDNISFIVRSSFLAFPTSEIRDQFLEDHRELIEKAKPLL